MSSARSSGNLFDVAGRLPSSEELFETLLESGDLRIERIVSTGQQTPPGEWYGQDRNEWVVLLSGAARLRFEDETSDRDLREGDWLHIPAHCRHRVEWTSPDEVTVWLAVHFVS